MSELPNDNVIDARHLFAIRQKALSDFDKGMALPPAEGPTTETMAALRTLTSEQSDALTRLCDGLCSEDEVVRGNYIGAIEQAVGDGSLPTIVAALGEAVLYATEHSQRPPISPQP